MRTCSRISFIIILSLSLFCSCSGTGEPQRHLSEKDMKEFEAQAQEIETDLVLNNTYDLDNIATADSLYEESVRVGSAYGKRCALRIKYYAYVAYPEHGDDFLEAVDEFISLVKQEEDKSDYYDAMNAKLYYLLGAQKFMAAQIMVREVMEEAEKSEDNYGLYFSNYMMSTVCQNRDNYGMAVQYLLKAEDYADGDSTLISIINKELSVSYGNMSDFDSAIDRALKSMNYASSTVHKAWAEQQYLSTLFDAHRDDEFLKAYETSAIKRGEYDDVMPDYLKDEIDIRRSICRGDFNHALRLAEDVEFDQLRLNDLFGIYERQGDYKKALEAKVSLDVIEDSLMTAISSEDLSEMEAQLGNSRLKLQAERLKMKNLRTRYISVILIFALAVIAGLLFFLRHRSYTKSLQKKNEELDKALEAAEKASDIKSIFIKNMTHEFHTPLNHISGFAQVLASEDMPLDEESIREMSAAIVESSKHLTDILDNIVDVADHLSSMTELENAESAFRMKQE